MNKNLRILTILSFFVCAFVFTNISLAATIYKVKGRKAMIRLNGESYSKGDTLYIIDKRGKKRGILKIVKVKGTRAMARIVKGKARKGYALMERRAKKKVADNSSWNSGSHPLGTSYWGAMLGFGVNKMDVELEVSSTTANLTGSAFSAKGLLDYAILDSLWFRGLIGMEGFNAAGVTDAASCGGECKAELNYLTFDFWGRYLFSKGSIRPWAGVGFDLLFPMAKTATVLEKTSITNTSVIAFGGGIDWFLSGKMFIPIQVEFNMFPSSELVKASTIAIRAGAAWEF